MVTRAALQDRSPSDAEPGIAAGSLTSWSESCLAWQRRDLNRALTCFTFVADVTPLSSAFRFAGDDQTLVARYDGLPFAAIAFRSRIHEKNDDVSQRVAVLTRQPVSPDESFACLVAGRDWPLLQATYHVMDVYPDWQMAYRDDPLRLDFTVGIRAATHDDCGAAPGVRARFPELPSFVSFLSLACDAAHYEEGAPSPTIVVT